MDDAFLIETGEKRTIRFASIDGKPAPAKDDLESLKPGNRAKFATKMSMLALNGWLKSPEQMRQIGEDGIWEIKIDGHRMACFNEGEVWFMTHVFKKQRGDGRLKKQIARAIEIREAHRTDRKKADAKKVEK